MIIVLQGNDQMLREEKRKDIFARFKTDDFNYTELSDSIEIGELTAALQQSPMMADYYFVVVYLNKRQFIRLKDYFKTTELTVLLLVLEDFTLGSLTHNLIIDEMYDCRQKNFKDTVRWLQQEAKSRGFSMDLDDRKQLALMFQSSSELADVIRQMGLLNEFDRSVFFSELFSTRQKFVWELFISLIEGKKKDFFSKYATQHLQNVELSPSQFNMKLIGGILYCLNTWKDTPQWIYEKLQILEEREERVPFLYSYLIELLPLARKTQSNIPILTKFIDILEEIKKV